jgi:hypothetical protein
VTAVDTSPCDVRSLSPAERVDEDCISATAFGAGLTNRLIGFAIPVENLR